MNIPAFTLIHRRPEPGKRAAKTMAQAVAEMADLARPLEGLRPKYRQLTKTLLTSVGHITADLLPAAVENIQIVSSELQREKNVTTVGIWDLGARMGRLPTLMERLNTAQPMFVFFEVEAGIPAGLISQPERIVGWAKDRLGRSLRPQERTEMTRNIIANDFFPRAETVRSDLGLDYLVGLTPSMVAGEDDAEVYWNHISTFEDHTVLTSVQDLRLFAKKAGRPFEALVGGVIVAQLFVAMFENPNDEDSLGFHVEDRGCLFDYNKSRDSIIRVARDPRIEQQCLEKIPTRFRKTALALVEILKNYPSE